MKRLLPIAMLALLTAGCNSDARRIVGTWYTPRIGEVLEQQMTLTADGQYRLWVRPRPGAAAFDETIGRYSIEAGRLTLTAPAGAVQYKIASITEKSLVLETVVGPIAIMSYTRVTQPVQVP